MSFSILALVLSLFALLPSVYSSKAVLSGGYVDSLNADVYNAFINQASPNGRAPYIGVVTAGTTLEVAQSTADSIISQLRDIYGVRNVEWLPYHPDDGTTCSSTRWNSMLNSMTGIYFNGGDSQMLLDCFQPNGRTSSALSIILSRYSNGSLAVYGSSAGALVMQSNPFLKIQDSWNALVYGPNYIGAGGFGIFNHGFLDVHFSTRGRHGAFARLIYDFRSYGTIGFGIDQDTAIVMDNENSFRVAGTGAVYIFDVGSAIKGSTSSSNHGRWAVRNIRVFYLTAGDRYYFNTGMISFASGKKVNAGNNVSAKYTADIFSDNAFTSLSTRFFNANRSTSTYGYTSELYPRYRVNLFKKSNSRSYVRKTNGVSKMSYANLYIDIYCMSNC